MTGLLGIFLDNPIFFFVVALALALSITVHEFAHAYTAYKLGDPTAKSLGRLTLNPLAHLDPLGTLSLLLLGFGWGKSVPVNYYNLKNPQRDMALISFAGPGSNFAMALILTGAVKMFEQLLFPDGNLAATGISLLIKGLIYPIILYNIILGLFNLIPIEPLDGFKIVNGILPPRLSAQWVQMAPFGLYILIFLAATGGISRLLSPAVSLILDILKL